MHEETKTYSIQGWGNHAPMIIKNEAICLHGPADRRKEDTYYMHDGLGTHITPSHLSSNEKHGPEHDWRHLTTSTVESEGFKNCLKSSHVYGTDLKMSPLCSSCCPMGPRSHLSSDAEQTPVHGCTIVTKSEVESEGFKARFEILTCINIIPMEANLIQNRK